jgi:hypothetical protein
MRRKQLARYAALLTTGGFVFSSSGTTCSEFWNSLLGSFTSPGSGGQDTDGDGFTDAQELNGGSDSFDPASTPNHP